MAAHKKHCEASTAPRGKRISPKGIYEINGLLEVPVLPLAENVVFPRSVHPLTLQGEQARALVDAARASGNLVALFLQEPTSPNGDMPAGLPRVGTLSSLSEFTASEEGQITVTAQGLAPVTLLEITCWEPYVSARVLPLEEPANADSETESLASELAAAYRKLLSFDPAASASITPALEATSAPDDLAYLIAATLPISPQGRQSILEAREPGDKLRRVEPMLNKALQLASSTTSAAPRQVEDKQVSDLPPADAELSGPQGRQLVDKTRRNLSGNLSGNADQAALDRATLTEQIEAAHLSGEAARVAARELERLSLLTPTSPDYNLVRTYLQWLADLPWHDDEGQPGEIDLSCAAAALDREHYGLEEIKRRIIEHLAVRKLRHKRSADESARHNTPDRSRFAQPVLCLVGPPGVGKTSLGRSIADALQRPFVRISLGGVSDEAEVRGHRRTYLGSMPGRILQALARVKSRQPVIMLDELDKLGTGGKGDPIAALLDVLDPEQQREFVDHYIDVPFDISSVLFIATANAVDAVPDALRDRLEVVRLSGYTEEEKVQIALRHLIPKQMEWHALLESDLVWQRDAVLEIIRSYTREAGVRQLERQIGTVCRRIATLVAQEDAHSSTPYLANPTSVQEILGTPRFLAAEPQSTDQPGVVPGVFWTPVGGDLMHIEAIMMPGGKTLTITGQLGEVMRESAWAALSYVRANSERLGIDPSFYDTHDIHLHIPSGAVPKDGPSAGVSLAIALVSLLKDVPVSGDLAMTGEITLRGRILPVGGIKEKVLAARRAGMRKVLLPTQNRRDLDAIASETLRDLQVLYADTMEDALESAFPGLWGRARRKRQHEATRTGTLPGVRSAARGRNEEP